MLYTTKNWSLNSYTNATWTDVVAEAATIATITIANTTASPVEVQLRVEDGGSSLATILPPYSIGANDSYTLDVRSLNITGTQALQFQADAAGAEIFVSGVI